jgi:hypothetical protein
VLDADWCIKKHQQYLLKKQQQQPEKHFRRAQRFAAFYYSLACFSPLGHAPKARLHLSVNIASKQTTTTSSSRPLHGMWRTSLALAVAVVITVWTAASAQDIQIPAALYDNAAGEWSVEVLSSCRPPTYGTVKFQNTTARVEWEDEGAPDVLISGQSTDAPLSLAALAEFMTKEDKEYSYETCEHQENYVATPQRPVTVARMTSTYVTMYTGVLSNSNKKGCGVESDRSVVIYALGSPLKANDKGPWRLQEALHAIDIVVETKDLAGTCAHMRSTEAAETALEGRRRSRKHRTGRSFNSVSVASQADEILTENGVVTVRLIRRSAAAPSWAMRYYTPIVFATIVIVYRVAHSFMSTRAAKTSL